jgi:hypothetical protein
VVFLLGLFRRVLTYNYAVWHTVDQILDIIISLGHSVNLVFLLTSSSFSSF